MCDYSLTGIRNRLAVEGEQLVVHRFPTRSIGLTSPAELEVPEVPVQRGWWSALRRSLHPAGESACAVCVPPGARLLLQDIPRHLQALLKVGPEEEVTFDQLSPHPYRYRDVVRFKNGQAVLLQQLADGQRVVVLSLVSEETSRLEHLVVAE